MTASNRPRILLFHRLDLAVLFAGLSEPLSRRLDVLHLPYSPEEKAKLKSLGIFERAPTFKERIRELHSQVSPSTELLKEIDDLIIEQTDGAFTLNSAIQSDRGFALLNYSDALHLTATYYVFWSRFIEEQNIDFIVHEPCTLMFNFLPALILSKRGGAYLYNIMAPGRGKELSHLTMTGFDFTCPEINRTLNEIRDGTREVDRLACEEFLDDFRKNRQVFLGGVIKKSTAPVRLAARVAKNALINLRNRSRHDRILDNIEHWQFSHNWALLRFRNVLGYRHIEFDTPAPTETYFFYPLHLEPEAVVLYHAHGIYENQVKLIQNIAGQLPPETWLYVKDHPHDIGYRSTVDYLRIKAIPNVRLLDPRTPGREVIRNAVGVITLTGTAGFEALLFGKQIYTFGKTFYSAAPHVKYLHHIRDLRSALYSRRDAAETDDVEIYPYLSAYLTALHPGLTDYFDGRGEKYGVDANENFELVTAGLLKAIEAR